MYHVNVYELRTWLYSRDQATGPDATVAFNFKIVAEMGAKFSVWAAF